MVGNGYIDQSIQKGFLPGVGVCVEHTRLLMETLLDAKRNAKEIVVAWLELPKTYGSVAHNHIQYVLEWYHVPTNIRELVYYYYDELFVRIRPKEYKSEWFMYQIGPFQGCPLSVVLFLIVFNLLLDLSVTSSELHTSMWYSHPFNLVVDWKSQQLRVRAFFHKTVRVCHVYSSFKIGFTCRITVIFGTLKDGSLLINTLASNICFSSRNMFQNGVDALSKIVDAFLSKSSKFYLVRIIR